MAALVDRTEFRGVLKEVVKCLREQLDVPGLAPLDPKQILSWFGNVSLQDLEAVMQDIAPERSEGQDGAG